MSDPDRPRSAGRSDRPAGGIDWAAWNRRYDDAGDHLVGRLEEVSNEGKGRAGRPGHDRQSCRKVCAGFARSSGSEALSANNSTSASPAPSTARIRGQSGSQSNSNC